MAASAVPEGAPPEPKTSGRIFAALDSLAKCCLWFFCYDNCCWNEDQVSPGNLIGQELSHRYCSYLCCCCFHGYGLHAIKKECFGCCRCRQLFNTMGDVDAHSYLEYLELFGKDDLPPPSGLKLWRCYGCLREFKGWQRYYEHLPKAIVRVQPGEDPRFLNLINHHNFQRVESTYNVFGDFTGYRNKNCTCCAF